MPKLNQGRSGRTGAGAKRCAVLGLVAMAVAATLAGCDEQLPGFAKPPPYDAGDQADADAAAGEDDAG